MIREASQKSSLIGSFDALCPIIPIIIQSIRAVLCQGFAQVRLRPYP